MLELLFLLLPVAAAYGWYMGRRSAQQSKQDDASRLSRDYVAGVNFLLSNQQDKAVALFLDMLKEDTGTVEAHLTLGNLFRSRGEVDRAIRIHQSLMESASLTYDQRLLAVQQLGRDYMAAGLYDRAEDMFKQLVDETDFRLHHQSAENGRLAGAVPKRCPGGANRPSRPANRLLFYRDRRGQSGSAHLGL